MNEHPEELTVVDGEGIPDHVLRPQEVLDAGFTLACRLGAARGDQTAINDAISEVLHTWGDGARYVFVSALTQLSRDLVPMLAELTEAATGVDFAAHCEAMLAAGYDPSTVDREG
ncbi:hypothetical protein MTQ12_01755 [Brevibacterium sp. R8603A2]|uniref:hypothetical protein n=1 Tax=Brevibacterium sp. R8603A2 TaxID=2929779 RepID=UPI001FFACB31|nr:hypothetical protein [Brevibacterium sp. R8603A2]MCK1801785.1 hypothetical protein [Brevibacterium sp. R8603A2]